MSFRIFMKVTKNNEVVFWEQIFANNEYPDALKDYFKGINFDFEDCFDNIEIPINDLLTIMRKCEINRKPPFWLMSKIEEEKWEKYDRMNIDFSEQYSSNSELIKAIFDIENYYLVRFPILLNRLIRNQYIDRKIERIKNKSGETELIFSLKEKEGVKIMIKKRR